MPISEGDPITQAAFDALATLASSKFPSLPTFAFPPFAGTDQIELPAKIIPAANYGSGSFMAGATVAFWLFSYKTIGGKKTYSYLPITSDFKSNPSSGDFSMTWTWVSPTGATAPDGYVAVNAFSAPDAPYQFNWKDIGNVQTLTVTSPSFPGFVLDQSMGDGGDATNLPCGNAIWLKLLNRIRQTPVFLTDIMCLNSGDVTGLVNIGGIGLTYDGSITPVGIDGLVSGPWCVGVCDALANTLTAWVPRTSIYIVAGLGVPTFSPGYTQCYRNIKFYFRHADVPNIDISYQNQLLSFVIGSDPLTTSTAHYHLKIVSCSDGHIKVQDTGGGTVWVDMDVVAGNTYDISFDWTGLTPTGLPFPKTLDFVFTSPDVMGAGTPAAGIEYGNDVRSIDVPDSYCEIEFNNFVTDAGLGGTETIQLCTTCLQLTLTEQNGVSGIWVANTIPSFGVMPYLDQDLPTYLPSESFPADTRRFALDGSKPYIPVVNNRGALWPVFRDTDFTPDSLAGLPFNGSLAWQKSIFTKYVQSNSFSGLVPPYEPSETLFLNSLFVPDGSLDVRFFLDNPAETLYVKANSPPTLSDFDASAIGGNWISLASAVPGFATNTFWYWGIYNPTSGNINTTSRTVVIQSNELPNGTFFPTSKDNLGVVIPITEGYSYKFSDTARTSNYPIPLLGYCVYSIKIRRAPVDNGFGIAIAPSAGTSDLDVSVGIMVGFGFGAAGTFTNIQTFTIPSGQPEVVAAVFWPVLNGTPLAYQSDEGVAIRAEANFQPQCHSTFTDTQVSFGGEMETVGFWSGPAWFSQNQALLSFIGGFITDPITLPIGATIINDLESFLNLL